MRLLVLALAACGIITLLRMGWVDGTAPSAAQQTERQAQATVSNQDRAWLIKPKGLRIAYEAGSYPLLSLPDGQQEVVRSVLNIDTPMQFGNFVWNEDGIPEGIVWVRVDLARQLLSVFRDGHEIGSSVILYGAQSKRTPVGSFKVLDKKKDYHSRSYDTPMPYMLRLTDDFVAIHGSDVREGFATHGCIGVPLEFAAKLFNAMQKGDKVVILPADKLAEKA